MEASMWAYPWDLEDCGMGRALEEMQESGLTGVSVITSYHAGRFLCVRSPKRKVYYPEDGTIYYPTDMSRFKGLRIQPRISRFSSEHPDFWDRLLTEADKRRMTVSGWTVCLHNTRIGTTWPDVCVRNAFGDPACYNPCPSHPDMRAYMVALMDDLCSHLPLHALELESMNFMGFAHEFHHEKDGIGLTALGDFLLSLCFCPSCVERARREGVDILPAARRVKGWLEQMCEGTLRLGTDEEFLRGGIAFFDGYPEVQAYLRWRPGVITSLMREVHAATGGRTRLYFLSLLPHSRSWLFGVDLREITRCCEGVVVCSYDCDERQAEADLRESRRDFAPGAQLMMGVRCFTPEYADGAALRRKLLVAKRQKADGLRLYNYGLIPRERMRWIRAALEE